MAEQRINVLLIEDEREVAALVQTMLSKADGQNVAVQWVNSLNKGIALVKEKQFDVVILDLGLPDSMGVKTISTFRAEAPDIAIVVVSGQDDEATVFGAMQEGAQDFLVKGRFSFELLRRAVHYAISRKRADEALRQSEIKYRELANSLPEIACEVDANGTVVFANRNAFEYFGYSQEEFEKGVKALDIIVPEDKERASRNMRAVMEGEDLPGIEYMARRKDGSSFPVIIYTNPVIEHGRTTGFRTVIVDISERKRMESELKDGLRRLRRTLDGTVNALSSAVELRDPYTAGHERKVARLSCAIAEKMGYRGEKFEGIRVAAVLHDVGKIAVPAEILSKPGPLTDMEYSIIKTHPRVGHDILAPVEFPWPVARIVLEHHEREDGSGYPQGLLPQAMLQESKILGVADVVESMSSHRPYRAALGIEKALVEIVEGKGEKYAPDVVDVCVKLFKEDGFALQED